MADKGLSQSEVARRVGVTQATVYRLVQGKAYGTTHLHKLAEALDTTPAFLLGEVDDPHANAPATPALSSQEAQLLSAFRQLGAAERDAILTLVGSILGRELASLGN